MSAQPARVTAVASQAHARVVLFGVGAVGRALLARCERLAPGHAAIAALQWRGIGNSRRQWHGAEACAAGDARVRFAASAQASDTEALFAALGHDGPRIVIDATASEEIAALHSRWLADGVHVVTACKLGQGTSLARWQAIRAAQARSGAHYGDAATVGAGLPLLRSLRALRAGGDRVQRIAGVLSGSLGWLFSRYDGGTPFSLLLEDAVRRGYTEPDPRDDLGGEDVRRKLLILARSAGLALEQHAVATESLLAGEPAALAALDPALGLAALDAPLQRRHADAARAGRVLRYVARVDDEGARVGLEALRPDDPLAQGDGCDNRVAIWSERYADRPLLIQGPGAGAEVTAAALLDDVLEIARVA